MRMPGKSLILVLLLATASAATAQSPGAAATGGAPHQHTDRHVRFKQIDKNGDGKLSLEEFVYRPEADGSQPKPDAKTIADRTARFRQGDTNHDGYLSFDEFEALSNMPVPSAK